MQLRDAKPKTSNIPALKSDDGCLVFGPTAKANGFAEKFTAKYTLIPAERNAYSDIIQNMHAQLQGPLPTGEVAVHIIR